MRCGDNHHNWHCTLEPGHDGVHMDRSLVDGFLYLSWPNADLPDPGTERCQQAAPAAQTPRGTQ